MLETTAYPFELNAAELQPAITAAYSRPTFRGWHLEAPNAADIQDGGRRRRMGIVFALGLPGPVVIDVPSEVTFHKANNTAALGAPDADQWADMLSEMLERRTDYQRDREARPIEWCDNRRDRLRSDKRLAASSGPGVVAYSWSQQEWGWQVILNGGSEEAHLGDGSITIASSIPYGVVSHVSDNDNLPADVAIWFACK